MQKITTWQIIYIINLKQHNISLLSRCKRAQLFAHPQRVCTILGHHVERFGKRKYGRLKHRRSKSRLRHIFQQLYLTE